MIGRTISHYRILEKLGEGGMGVVYRALDTKLEREAALKFLPERMTSDENARARFVHEARAASALDHPNIATVYEVDEADGRIFIAMSLVEGRSLKRAIEEEALSIPEMLDAAIQVCEGLHAAHEKGIVHRDIKPGNIMITPKGRVKILDFGLAKLRGASRLTSLGSTLGTVAYMSPEQVKGMDVDNRSDIFSIGVMLYEMAAGEPPFTGEHEAALMYSIVHADPREIRELRADAPRELAAIIGRALEKDPAARYQHVSELLSDLERLRESMTAPSASIAADTVHASGGGRRGSGRLRRWLAAALLGAAVVIAGLTIGIRIHIDRQTPAAAAENTLLIMYFDNMTDPEDAGRLGEMVASLLIVDLSESHYLSVVSSQRLNDVLRQLGAEDTRRIAGDVAAEAARRTNARWMLTGRLVRTEPRLAVVGELVEVESGNTIASQRITGEPGDDVFAIVDRLTVEIKKDLSLRREAFEEPDRSVTEVTTGSMEAYRHYLEGMDYADKLYYEEAEEAFTKALAADSTFALVPLAMAANGIGDVPSHLEKASRYSDRLGKKDRHFLNALIAKVEGNHAAFVAEIERILETDPNDLEAHRTLAEHFDWQEIDLDEAISHGMKAIEIDPKDKRTYNMLAYLYNEAGDLERSLWAINKYIELAPDEANPYDSRGELYALHGKLDEAIASYSRALEIKPDFELSLEGLALMHLYKREYRDAELVLQRFFDSGSKELRSRGRLCLSLIPAYRGHFAEMLLVLDEGAAIDRLEGYEEHWLAAKYRAKTNLLIEAGRAEEALRAYLEWRGLYDKLNPSDITAGATHYVMILHEMGRHDAADSFARSLEPESGDRVIMSAYHGAAAINEYYKGNPGMAYVHMKSSGEMWGSRTFGDQFLLGLFALEAGRLGEAVEHLEWAVGRYDPSRVHMLIAAPKIHYYLGRAYEESGWTVKALEQYEEYLDIRGDADPGVPFVEEARERLEALGKHSPGGS